MYHKGDEDPERVATPWMARDMPMRWEMLVENVSDPSHVPFSHHGVQGNRSKPTQPTFDDVITFTK
jgi:phenylpropionate dioxygenase-like ring-hydroxylating dioxygenase large terminal subunit